MPDRMRVFAGDCTTMFEDSNERTQRGHVVVLIKPDNTTLVHDADGYQPVEWLTRPDSVTVETDGDGFSVIAKTPDRTLRIVAVDDAAGREIPVTEAGTPVGTCPDCAAPLVRTGGDVVCLDCDATYGLPSGASVTDQPCEDCGLPKIRVERGEPFQLCLDPNCERLPDVVTDRFDGEWDCPECGADLDVKEAPGRVFLGCSNYPDCETTFSMPAGVVVDDCPCGLPVFGTPTGRRCLDGTCGRWQAVDDGDRHRPNVGERERPDATDTADEVANAGESESAGQSDSTGENDSTGKGDVVTEVETTDMRDEAGDAHDEASDMRDEAGDDRARIIEDHLGPAEGDTVER